MSERRQPWMKWYPADWRADPGLRMCSFAARGLWADLLALMHEGEPYGHLTINGRVPTSRKLAVMLGGTAKEIDALIAELMDAGVPSRTDDGVIYSRRMVRDKAKQDTDRANGKGGGNPRLKGSDNPEPKPPVIGGDKPGDKRGVNPPVKAQKLEARGQTPESRSEAAASSPPRASHAEPPAAAAESDRRCEIGKRVLAAARIDEARWIGNFAIISAWLSVGYDPDLDILPAVNAVAARPGYKPPNSLNYFTKPIGQHWESRQLAVPDFLRREPESPAERAHTRALELWAANGCQGPKPERPEAEAA